VPLISPDKAVILVGIVGDRDASVTYNIPVGKAVINVAYNTGMDILALFLDDTLPACLGHLEPAIPQGNLLGMGDDTPSVDALKGFDRPAILVQVAIDEYLKHRLPPW
jgi:hypothetical protein